MPVTSAHHHLRCRSRRPEAQILLGTFYYLEPSYVGCHFFQPSSPPSSSLNVSSSFPFSARRGSARRSIRHRRHRADRRNHKRKIHPHHCRRPRTRKTFWPASSTRNAGTWIPPSWRNAPAPRCPARNCRNEIRRLAWRNNKPARQKLKCCHDAATLVRASSAAAKPSTVRSAEYPLCVFQS